MDGAQSIDIVGDHADPVGQLMLAGKTRLSKSGEWPDYPAIYGIGQRDVGVLIRMACDPALHRAEPESNDVWAPVHAWRALGQLRADAAVEPLLALIKPLEHDDAADLELPVVFGMIGAPAVPRIAAFVLDRANPEWPVITALSALVEIAARHPDCREDCLEILTRVLQPDPAADPTVNGFAVGALLDMNAVESIDVMRAAFRRNAVDISIAGDIEEVEIELGLRNGRVTPKPRYQILRALSEPKREKIGRNEACPCGSGRKYKKCCLR